MISRIRLDAFGNTPDDIARTVYPHADQIEKILGVPVQRGECVIERNLNEPDASDFAFKGRLLIYPSIPATTTTGGNYVLPHDRPVNQNTP